MGQFTSKKNLKKRKFFNSTVLGYTSNYDNNRISQYHRKDSGFLLLNNKDQKHLIEEPETIFTFNDLLDTHLLYNIQDINLSRMKFKSLTSNIGLLTMITKLNLSYNQLCDIPESIGFLYQLEILVLSHNQIQSIPDTIGLLSQLYELDLSYNQIQQLTPFTSQLKSLHVFDISHNRLVTLTSRIGEIQTLASLDISYNNQLNYLPAEIIQLPSLRRLDLDGCVSFSLHHHHHHHLKHDPPSLLETCARYIVRNEDQFVSNDSHSIQSKITTRLFNYLCQYERCSHCHLPYFESYISKIRWIERNETMWIPIEYRLCSAHWIDERDRLYTTFSTSNHNNATKKIKNTLFKPKFILKGNADHQRTITRRSQQQKIRSSFNNTSNPINNNNNNTSSFNVVVDQTSFLFDSFTTTTLAASFEDKKRWKFFTRKGDQSLLKPRRLCS